MERFQYNLEVKISSARMQSRIIAYKSYKKSINWLYVHELFHMSACSKAEI